MKIIALDFETANADRGSICSVGLAGLENGVITFSEEYLVKPHRSCSFFHPFNIAIHGINAAQVHNSPEWGELWPKLQDLFVDATLIAHNAAFDISVLRKGLDLYGLPYPDLNYLCTCKISSLVWPDLDNHKLNTVCSHIGHRFKHHNARADAEAAALALQAMIDYTECVSHEELTERLKLKTGRLFPGGYSPCSVRKSSARR